MQPPVPYDPARFADALKAVVEGSAELTEWTVLTIAGTLAVLLSTSYVKPKGGWRAMYLLIPPALILLGIALMDGFRVRQAQMAFLFRKATEQAANDALPIVNLAFAHQLEFYFNGIGVLTTWLLFYMFWWMFVDES